jgi:hypothetical protein
VAPGIACRTVEVQRGNIAKQLGASTPIELARMVTSVSRAGAFRSRSPHDE